MENPDFYEVVLLNRWGEPSSPCTYADDGAVKKRPKEPDWMWDVVHPLPSEPSPNLGRLLAEAGPGVKGQVVRRADEIFESVFCKAAFLENKSKIAIRLCPPHVDAWAQDKRTVALKVYYMFLEAICTASAASASLLPNDLFHRCVLACSAELALAKTSNSYTIWLPVVLRRCSITGFDLLKIIGSFRSRKDLLPGELRCHLATLTERLMDSMVWEKDSSLYDLLLVVRPHLSAQITHLRLLAATPAQPKPLPHVTVRSKRSRRYVFRSIIPPDRRLRFTGFVSSQLEPPPPLHTAFACPLDCKETCAAKSVIDIFFTNILQLAAFRINNLLCVTFGEQLLRVHKLEDTVNHLVQQILSHQALLLFNRCLDQIIICSVYAVANMLEGLPHVKLHKLVRKYTLSHEYFDPVACQRVFVSGQEDDHVDLTTFYTQIFNPSVRPLLLDLGLAVDQ